MKQALLWAVLIALLILVATIYLHAQRQQFFDRSANPSFPQLKQLDGIAYVCVDQDGRLFSSREGCH